MRSSNVSVVLPTPHLISVIVISVGCTNNSLSSLKYRPVPWGIITRSQGGEDMMLYSSVISFRCMLFSLSSYGEGVADSAARRRRVHRTGRVCVRVYP